MIRLLYFLFAKQLNRFVFEQSFSGKDWRSYCEMAFVDELGRKYYRYKKEYKMPIKRMAYVDTLKVQYMMSWSQLEQAEFDKKLSNLIESITTKQHFSKFYKEVAEIETLLGEKTLRQGMVIQEDILVELVCAIFIREDEDPYEINDAIQAEKVEIVKKKINYTFLKTQDILSWIGLSGITEETFEPLLEYSRKMTQMRAEKLNLGIKK